MFKEAHQVPFVVAESGRRDIIKERIMSFNEEPLLTMPTSGAVFLQEKSDIFLNLMLTKCNNNDKIQSR